MRKIVSGALSFIVAGFWWLGDRLWGDTIFAAMRPIIPMWATNPPIWTFIDWTVSFGPPLILAGLGAYFIVSGRRQIKQAATDTGSTQDLIRDFQNGKWEIKYPPTAQERAAPKRRAVAAALDELLAEGVEKRNRLMPAIPDYDNGAAQLELEDWNERVIAILADDCITVAERSSFRTLDLYQAVATGAPGKSKSQEHMESMWTEKLRRLRLIINRVGQ